MYVTFKQNSLFSQNYKSIDLVLLNYFTISGILESFFFFFPWQTCGATLSFLNKGGNFLGGLTEPINTEFQNFMASVKVVFWLKVHHTSYLFSKSENSFIFLRRSKTQEAESVSESVYVCPGVVFASLIVYCARWHQKFNLEMYPLGIPSRNPVLVLSKALFWPKSCLSS